MVSRLQARRSDFVAASGHESWATRIASLGVRETTRVASLVGGTRIASLARAPGAQFNGWAKTRIVYFIGTQLEAGGV